MRPPHLPVKKAEAKTSLGSRFLPITRREFLGSAGATSALAAANPSLALDNGEYEDYDLRFELDATGNILTVTIVEIKRASGKAEQSQASECQDVCSWIIDRRSFSLDAVLELMVQDPPGQGGARYVLGITSITHGEEVGSGLIGRRLNFQFFLNPEAGVLRWHIRAETDIWNVGSRRGLVQFGRNSSRQNRVITNPIPFRKFIKDDSPLQQIVSSRRVTSVFRRYARGLLRADRNVEVSLYSDGSWKLGPGRGSTIRMLSGVAPNIRAGRATLRVQMPTEERQPPTKQGNELTKAASFAGLVIECSDVIADGLRLGDEGTGSVELQLVQVKSLVIRSTDASGIAQASLLGEWQATHILTQRRTGPFPCPDGRLLVVARPRVPTTVERSITFEAREPEPNQDTTKITMPLARWIDTPLGRLKVMSITPPQAMDVTEPPSDESFGSRDEAWLRVRATQTILDDPLRLWWFEAGMALVEAALVPDGVDAGRLFLGGVKLHLVQYDEPELPRGSFVRIGRVGQGEVVGRIDLSSATLQATRADDLAALRFRFSRLALEVLRRRTGDGLDVEVVNGSTTCGVVVEPAAEEPEMEPLAQPDDTATMPVDGRPILVVEFPPQHVMEEALFLPNAPPLPDPKINRGVVLKDRKRLVREAQLDNPTFVVRALAEGENAGNWPDVDAAHEIEAFLAALPDLKDRVEARRAIKEAKEAKISEPNDPDSLFKEFAKDYEKKAKKWPPRVGWGVGWGRRLPSDQKIFIGDAALDPDARIIAREVQKERAETDVRRSIDALLANVRSQAFLLRLEPDVRDHETDFWAALQLERRLEATVPTYQLLRDFYRERRTAEVLSEKRALDPKEVEWVINLCPGGQPSAEYPAGCNHAWAAGQQGRAHQKRLIAEFSSDLLGADRPDGLMRARLSARSRLAFRVDCRDALTAARAARMDLDPDGDAALLAGRNRRAWSLASLTDWSGMELNVVPLAQTVYKSGPGGRLDQDSIRKVDPSASSRLDHLGFTGGSYVSASLRMAEVADMIRRPPGRLDTELVIPARLSLSPTNGAVVQTTGTTDPDIYTNADDAELPEEVVWPLWRAWIDTKAAPPRVRVVHSPDLRPEALLGSLHEVPPVKQQAKGSFSGIRIPGGAAPPLGHLAPWVIGREETHNGEPAPSALAAALDQSHLDPEDAKTLQRLYMQGDEAMCVGLADPGTARRMPRLLAHLCARLGLRSGPDQAELRRAESMFRTSLSANDRHQLVLLGSAWGLPSLGDRAKPGTAEPTRLVPEGRHVLADVMPGAMLYNPQSLAVEELVLTVLGGTLRHDTAFSPPVSPFYLSGQRLYDALSIERWQHWTQLGRDIRVEVVYKGYLYPIGHRASLVKLTERTFRRDQTTRLVRAYLRQRLFIRVSEPDKAFPALAQPNAGRRFPLRRMAVITAETPDLADPLMVLASPAGTADNTVLPGGRVILPHRKGLVFWPRLTLAEGSEVRFDLACDSVPTRMPLLFVDNTAANDEEVLRDLAAYYNAHSVGLRTIPVGGSKLRYAPELRAEQSSFETQSWVLGVEGKQGDPPKREGSDSSTPDGAPKVERLRFSNNVYAFTPELLAADQPPFYPIAAGARILLRQNERLTGTRSIPHRAVFDARYVADGLPQAGELAASKSESPISEDPIELLAKDRGNEMQIVLLLVDQPQQSMGDRGERTGGIARPAGTIVALSRSKGPVTSATNISLKVWQEDQPPVEQLPSLALAHTQKPPEGSSSTSDGSALDGSDFMRLLEDIRGALMSIDAKLLGVVKLSDILRLATGKAPELLERVVFGAASGAAQESATAAQEWLKEQVLHPLDAGLDLSLREWAAMESDVAAAQKDLAGVKPFTLAELFGPLDTGLRGMKAAVAAALAESDPILFAVKLGSVHEDGRRLLDAITEVATRPLEGFELAVQERVRSIRDVLGGQFQQMTRWATYWVEMISADLSSPLAEAMIPGAENDPWIVLPLPIIDLTEEERKNLSPTVGEVRGIVKEMLTEITKRRSVQDILDPNKWPLNKLRDNLREKLAKTIENASESSQTKLMVYKAFLADPISLRAFLAREFALPLQILGDIEAVKSALAAGPPDIPRAAQRAHALLSSFVELPEIVPAALCTPSTGNENRSFVADLLISLGEAISLDGTRFWPTNLNGLKKNQQPEACKIDPETLVLDPAYLPAEPANNQIPELIAKALMDVHEKLKQLAEETNPEGTAKSLIQAADSIPGGARVKNVVVTLHAALAGSLPVRDGLLRRLSELHCALATDSLRIDAFGMALDQLVGKLRDSGTCADIAALAKPLQDAATQANMFLPARQFLIERLLAILSATAEDLDALLRQEDIRPILLSSISAFAVGQALEEPWDTYRKDILYAANQLAKALVKLLLLIARELKRLTDKIDKLVRTADVLTEKLADQVEAVLHLRIEGLTELQERSESLNAQMTALVTELEKADRKRSLSLEDLDRAIIDIRGAKYSILLMFRIPLRVEGDFSPGMHLLREVDRLFRGLAELVVQRVRQAFPRVEQEVLKRLDAPVVRALQAGQTGKQGAVLKFYMELNEALNNAIANSSQYPLLSKVIRAARDLEPRSGLDSPGSAPPADRLDQDVAILTAAAASGGLPISNARNRRFLRMFIEEWGTGKATPLVMAEGLTEVFADIIREEIAQLVDISAMRARIEEHIQRIVPTAVELRYDIDTAVPSKIKESTGGVFIPGDNTHLKIDAVARIALDIAQKNLATNFRSEGHIGPFDIKLVGDFVDALTIRFAGADFFLEPGAEPRFEPSFVGVTIGQDLQFIKPIEDFFKKFPIKVEPRPGGGPGVVIIYEQNLPFLPIGPVTFSDLIIRAGVELAFDSSPTIMRAGVGRPLVPFTVSIPPWYGGSGFFSIAATADGIIGFEASFEWGGSRPFEFGPLYGNGRLMIGIYISQIQLEGRTGTSIFGTFFAGGSAQIWIFSLAAALYVRLGMEDNGDMKGDATFTYSFSLGLQDVEFDVAVEHTENSGFQGGERSENGGTRGALPLRYAGPVTGSSRRNSQAAAEDAVIRTQAVRPDANWQAYRQYFDEAAGQQEVEGFP